MRKTYGESTSTPWSTTTDLRNIAKKGKDGLVPKRDVDHTVVRKRAHGSNSRALLSTAHSTSGDEQTRVLAPKATILPLAASLIPEDLPLSGEVAVPGRDTEEEGVVLLHCLWVRERRDFVGFGRDVHLGQDVFGERFLDAVEVGGAAGGTDALLLGFGKGLDMAVGGVLEVEWLVDGFVC